MCTIGRFCSRCTGFVVIATYVPAVKCQHGRMYSLQYWPIGYDGSAYFAGMPLDNSFIPELRSTFVRNESEKNFKNAFFLKRAKRFKR